MKSIFTILFLSAALSSVSAQCGGGATLHSGSKGGCYYINSNGNKTYVDRSCCGSSSSSSSSGSGSSKSKTKSKKTTKSSGYGSSSSRKKGGG